MHHTTDFDQTARRPRGAGLLLFDVDGTLIDGGHPMSERTRAALASADAAGYVCALCTGRPYALVTKEIERAGAVRYAVCANGAQVIDVESGKTICSRPLGRDAALRAHTIASAYRAGFNAFVGDAAYFEWRSASYLVTGRTSHARRALDEVTPVGESPKSAYCSLLSPRRLARFVYKGLRFCWRLATDRRRREVVSVRPVLERGQGAIHKMGCTVPSAEGCRRARTLLLADGAFEVAMMGATELEITAAGVNKASGATILMERLGIDAAHAWAFGDGGNDLPLSEVVGTFVAMGNAEEEVREAADEVCGTAAEDGVAVWLEGLLART